MKLFNKVTVIAKMALIMLCLAHSASARDRDGQDQEFNNRVNKALSVAATGANCFLSVHQMSSGLADTPSVSPIYNIIREASCLFLTRQDGKPDMYGGFTPSNHNEEFMMSMLSFANWYNKSTSWEGTFRKGEYLLSSALLVMDVLKYMNPTYMGLDAYYGPLAFFSGTYRLGRILYNRLGQI